LRHSLFAKTKFLHTIADRLSKWEHLPQLGDIYVKTGWLTRLGLYIEQYEASGNAILEKYQSQEVFTQFRIEAERSYHESTGRNRTISDLLRSPVSHLSKCYLLLQDLLQCTDATSADYALLTEAVSAVQQLAQMQITKFSRMTSMTALLTHKDSSWKFWKKSKDSASPPRTTSPQSSSPSNEVPSIVVGLNPVFLARSSANPKLRVRTTSAPYPFGSVRSRLGSLPLRSSMDIATVAVKSEEESFQ